MGTSVASRSPRGRLPTWSSFRERTHGRPVDTELLNGHQFLGFAQNHDQIGNRALGERTSALLSPDRLRIAAAIVLTTAFTPLIFMGEEWGASTPWQYFTNHPEPDLGRAIREGRTREFARHGWTGQVPDPQAPETFARSRLDWTELTAEPHRSLLRWYRSLISLRRRVPDLMDRRLAATSVDFDEQARWLVIRRGAARIAVNLADHPQIVPVDRLRTILLSSHDIAEGSEDGLMLPADSVVIGRTDL